jgi:hypothetical protein
MCCAAPATAGSDDGAVGTMVRWNGDSAVDNQLFNSRYAEFCCTRVATGANRSAVPT